MLIYIYLQMSFNFKIRISSPKVQPAGLNGRRRGDNGVVLRFVVWDFIPGRSYQGGQARYHQLMIEPRPTLAGYGEALVLQQGGCGLCNR